MNANQTPQTQAIAAGLLAQAQRKGQPLTAAEALQQAQAAVANGQVKALFGIAPIAMLVVFAAPVLGQATFGDVNIPASQVIPPAGFDQVAFRPSCPQVVPVGQANGLTAWTLPMPDGANLTLLELEPMDTTQAHMVLDSYGLCKIGGDAVPIVYSRQLPQRSIAVPVVEATGGTQPTDLSPTSEQPQGGGIVGLMVGSIALVAIGAGLVAYTRRKPQPLGAGPAPAESPKAKAQPDRRNALDDLLGGGR
jgi:hypothetical protein